MFPFDDDAANRLSEMFGSAQIDMQVRCTIYLCWVGLPRDRRSVDELESLFREIVERALRDFREDPESFRKTMPQN